MHVDCSLAKWKASTSSIDEEIARCMQSPLKRTRNVSNNDTSMQKIGEIVAVISDDNTGDIRRF